jgi:hypothetical protein
MSSYWTDIYADDGVQAEIYRVRTAAVLDWMEGGRRKTWHTPVFRLPP